MARRRQARAADPSRTWDSDVVPVLFEDVDGELRYLTGEDDSGEDRNGRVGVRFVKGRQYIVRTRLYSAWGSGGVALMYW